MKVKNKILKVIVLLTIFLQFFTIRILLTKVNSIESAYSSVCQEYKSLVRNNITLKQDELIRLSAEKRNKLVLRIYENGCHQCVDSIFHELSISTLDYDNIVIYHNFNEERKLIALIQRYNLDSIKYVYFENQQSDTIMKNYFIYYNQLGKGGLVFYPNPNNHWATVFYLKVIATLYEALVIAP